MKVLDVIKLVTRLLNESDDKKCVDYCEKNTLSIGNFLGWLTDSTKTDLPDFLNTQSEKDLRLILDCINITQMQICTDFHLLDFIEDIVVEDNQISVDTLSQKLYKVRSVTCNGEKVRYSFVGDKIILNNGKMSIKYAFIPKEVDFDDSIESHNGNLTLLSMAYGVCYHFCLIKGIEDEAQKWFEKFKNSLTENFRKVKEIKIKSRRWI